jgi:phenylacetate-CoA ligase
LRHKLRNGGDFTVLELVDPATKEPIEIVDGARGSVVVTSLDREALPYIKFELADVVEIFTKPCECGYPGPGYRINVVGRADDLLKIKGVGVYPAAIREEVAYFQPEVTGHIKIVLDEPPPRVIPPLKMKVEYGENVEKGRLGDLKNRLEERLHTILKIRPQIELVPPGALGRETKKTALIERAYEEKK